MSYHKFDGKPVNKYWYLFLTKARRAGVKFHVSSGHRTLPEQWRLYRIYKRDGWPIAAFPSPFAPHIKRMHACDVNVGTQDLIEYGARHGVRLTRTVPSEYWHLQPYALTKFYKRHKKRK